MPYVRYETYYRFIDPKRALVNIQFFVSIFHATTTFRYAYLKSSILFIIHSLSVTKLFINTKMQFDQIIKRSTIMHYNKLKRKVFYVEFHNFLMSRDRFTITPMAQIPRSVKPSKRISLRSVCIIALLNLRIYRKNNDILWLYRKEHPNFRRYVIICPPSFAWRDAQQWSPESRKNGRPFFTLVTKIVIKIDDEIHAMVSANYYRNNFFCICTTLRSKNSVTSRALNTFYLKNWSVKYL